VLDELRRSASGASTEIGGILLGRHSGRLVVITGAAPFHCEHAFGPSFTLSPYDESRLAGAIAAANSGSASEVVGWYRSLNRSRRIFFSDISQQLHKRFFPKPWQVGLVVKPLPEGGTTAGFFFWESDGSIQGDTCHHEFTLEPLAEQIPVDPPTVSRGIPQDDAPSKVDSVSPATGDGAAENGHPAEEPAATPPPDVPEESPAPAFLLETQTESSRRWIRPLLLTLVLVAAGAAGYASRSWWLAGLGRSAAPAAPAAPASIRLVTIDDEGELQILWDPTLPVIQQSSGATLNITEGGESRSLPVDSLRLRTGSITYSRQTGRVDVVFTIMQPDGHPLVQATTYSGRTPDREHSGVRKERDRLAEEVARLKSELELQTKRTQQLETMLNSPRRNSKQRKGQANQGATAKEERSKPQ
jgi:hypothetical protein